MGGARIKRYGDEGGKGKVHEKKVVSLKESVARFLMNNPNQAREWWTSSLDILTCVFEFYSTMLMFNDGVLEGFVYTRVLINTRDECISLYTDDKATSLAPS